MSRVNDLPVPDIVTVTPHARDQYRTRTDWPGTAEQLRTHVSGQIRNAISNGMVFDVKPRNFRRVGERSNYRLPVGQRFVVHGEVGFVVAPVSAAEVVVVTVLTPTQKVRMPR